MILVRMSGPLSDHVVSHDKACKDEERFQQLRAELTHAFAAPDSAYEPLTASDIIARNRT